MSTKFLIRANWVGVIFFGLSAIGSITNPLILMMSLLLMTLFISNIKYLREIDEDE